jgi:4-amino-4-deoxy-L-arabinose transferase-like glycosyltransferase
LELDLSTAGWRAVSAVKHGGRSDPARRDLNAIGPALVVLVILLLGFGLRVYRLGQQNIWWDEGHAIWAARQSLPEATRITAYDVHPPLYLWLLHGWMRWAGESEFAVRYLSTFGGMLTVALCYVVARRLVGRRAAMLAMLFLATARFHIWWSQEARMYVWATFFVLLSIYYLIGLHHRGYSAWLLYVLSSAAALYTLYLAALAVLLQNIFVACVWWRRPRRWRFLFNWVLAQVGVLMLYAPWVYLAFSRTRTDFAKTSFPARLVWQLYATVLTTGISTHLDRYLWVVTPIVLLALAGVALLVLDRRQPQRYGLASWEVGLLLLLPLVLPPLVVYSLSLPRGFFYSPKPEARYLLTFAPLFYILLAGTLASFWQKGRRGRIVTIVGAVLVLGTFVSVLPGHYAGRYLRDEYQTAMATLAAYAKPDDAVLLVSGDRYPVFFYYYHRRFPAGERQGGDTPEGEGPAVYLLPRHGPRFSAESVDHELEPLAEKHPRLWLASMERGLQDPDNVVQPWLDAHRRAALHVDQGYNSLRLYVEGGEVPLVSTTFQPQVRLDAVHGGDVLVGYDLPAREHRPGDQVNLGLYVRSQSTPLALGVDLVGSEGQVVATHEVAVPAVPEHNAVVRVTVPFAVYGYTTPGRYWAEVYIRGPGSLEMDGARTRLPVGRVTQSHRLPKQEIDQSLEVDLGEGQIRFLGFGLEPADAVQAGTPLTVDLHWQALGDLDKDYTVFVHLVGGYNPATGGPVWAQDDSWPLAGGHPTTRWLPGQVVVDRHVVEVPEGTPPGVYQIHVGLYDALTGERLSVADADQERIVIGEIELIH